MTAYNETKSKAVIKRIIEILENKEIDTGIDNTISILDTHLQELVNDLGITNFDFNFVKGLKKALSYENILIEYKDKSVLKVKKIGIIHFSENN